jgi:septum formation protein
LSISLVLGSQSPRRKEILESFTLPFVQAPSGFDEESIPFSSDPRDYTTQLSRGKAALLASRFPQEIILTADTIVFFEGSVFNKPRDETEAFSMLKTLSGHWHQVFTSITLRQADKEKSGVEETRILFNSLSDEQIRLYLQKEAFLDKAGAYAIQGAGSVLVRRLEGCYTNVVGLPINLLRELLCSFGIDLWHHLGSF